MFRAACFVAVIRMLVHKVNNESWLPRAAKNYTGYVKVAWHCPGKVQHLGGIVINPHQRCRYSDLPFVKKDTFLYCRVQKGVSSGRA